MLDEDVPLLEGALVDQELDALAGRQLALAVLRGGAALAVFAKGCKILSKKLTMKTSWLLFPTWFVDNPGEAWPGLKQRGRKRDFGLA
jgi:hypothetical protein